MQYLHSRKLLIRYLSLWQQCILAISNKLITVLIIIIIIIIISIIIIITTSIIIIIIIFIIFIFNYHIARYILSCQIYSLFT